MGGLIMEGWIKIHKRITQWEWYKDTHTLHLFIHLLLNANYEPKRWRGQLIERGQFVSSRLSLSRDTGIPEQSCRSALARLKSTNEVTSKSTNKYTLYTIVNYDKYQAKDPQPTSKSTSQLTNNQPATNHNIRIKEIKEESITPNNFDIFWQAYPNKKDRKDAAKAFSKVTESFDTVMAGLERYKKYKEDWRAWKMAATWLNGECWNDEVTPAQSKQTKYTGF